MHYYEIIPAELYHRHTIYHVNSCTEATDVRFDDIDLLRLACVYNS